MKRDSQVLKEIFEGILLFSWPLIVLSFETKCPSIVSTASNSMNVLIENVDLKKNK